MDDTERQFNNKVLNYFRNLESKLNRNTIVLDKQPGNVYCVPTITSLGNSQILPNDEGSAFNLNSPSVGMTRDVMKTDSDKKKVLIRRLVGYTFANRLMVMNDSEIEQRLNFLTTEMLLTLKKQLEFGPETVNAGQYYAKFKWPGTVETYFKEQETAAAYEIRLYSDTWSCIDLKEFS